MSLAAELVSSGISVQDAFLPPSEAAQLRACMSQREAQGDFAAARVGGAGAERRLQAIRGDFTCWLSEPLLPPESRLWDRLEQLRMELNREAFLGLFELEAHYAKYPPGAGYARHVDQPSGSRQRQLSLIIYLNSEWCSADGGALRIHRGTQDFLDVAPLEGRLACFLTADREHEVLPAARERLSISGWFRARP